VYFCIVIISILDSHSIESICNESVSCNIIQLDTFSSMYCSCIAASMLAFICAGQCLSH
jgi:hypothetical protein